MKSRRVLIMYVAVAGFVLGIAARYVLELPHRFQSEPQHVPSIEILHKQSYIAGIENSVGSKLFNTLYGRVQKTGEIRDILNDGDLSCAYFVSSILVLNGLMDTPYTTVDAVRSFVSGSAVWRQIPIDQIETGDIIFYQKESFLDGSENAHVGFALDSSTVVSTNYQLKMVDKRPIKYPLVDAVYRFSWLEN